MQTLHHNDHQVTKDFSNNKADFGEAIIGGIISSVALAGAIYTGNPVLYGATAIFIFAEYSAISHCVGCRKSQKKNTLQ